MSRPVRIVFRDETHLVAHRDDFSVPLQQVLDWIRARLEADGPRSGWTHIDFKTPQPLGLGGLRRLYPWSRGDFWARRRGRRLPSHLIVGRKRPTRWLCVWGLWADEETFTLHTMYPGRVAPREIHDPKLPLSELPGALAFWSRHAIVVSPGEWEP